VPYQCSNWQRSGYSCNDNHQPHNCAHTNRSQINTNIQQLIWQLHHCHCRVAVWGAKLFPNWVEYEHYVEYYWILMTSINNKIFSAMLWWDRDKLDVTRELVMCSRSTSTVPPTQQQQYTLGIIMKNCGLSHFKCHPDLDWVLMWTGKQWCWGLLATQHRAPLVVNLSHGYIGSSRKSKHIWRSTINDAYINKFKNTNTLRITITTLYSIVYSNFLGKKSHPKW